MTSPTTPGDPRPRLRWGLGLAAVLFGLATLFEGGKVLFGDAAARSAAGNIVPFVLWFNFSAGFFYIVAGAGALARLRWSVGLARVLAVSSVLVLIGLGLHIRLGGAFEARTPVAMTLRSAFWVTQAVVLARLVTAGSQLRASP